MMLTKQQDVPEFAGVVQYGVIADLFSQVRSASEHDPRTARMLVVQIADPINAEAPPGEYPTRRGLAPWQLKRVQRFVQANIATPIRLSQLAQLTRLSRGHFSRAFKLSAGVTAHGYIMRQRIELARRLISDTTLPLAEVALECGLSDQSHLSHMFHRFVGATPSQWRRSAIA
jgi:transcriptional regulator GlxA family with amidase domain